MLVSSVSERECLPSASQPVQASLYKWLDATADPLGCIMPLQAVAAMLSHLRCVPV